MLPDPRSKQESTGCSSCLGPCSLPLLLHITLLPITLSQQPGPCWTLWALFPSNPQNQYLPPMPVPPTGQLLSNSAPRLHSSKLARGFGSALKTRASIKSHPAYLPFLRLLSLQPLPCLFHSQNHAMSLLLLTFYQQAKQTVYEKQPLQCQALLGSPPCPPARQ